MKCLSVLLFLFPIAAQAGVARRDASQGSKKAVVSTMPGGTARPARVIWMRDRALPPMTAKASALILR